MYSIQLLVSKVVYLASRLDEIFYIELSQLLNFNVGKRYLKSKVPCIFHIKYNALRKLKNNIHKTISSLYFYCPKYVVEMLLRGEWRGATGNILKVAYYKYRLENVELNDPCTH